MLCHLRYTLFLMLAITLRMTEGDKNLDSALASPINVPPANLRTAATAVCLNAQRRNEGW